MKKWRCVTEITNKLAAAGGVWNGNRTLPEYGTGGGADKTYLKGGKEMKKNWRKALLAAAVAGAMLAGSAMPAFAEEEAAADLSGDLVIWEGTSERGACAEAVSEPEYYV